MTRRLLIGTGATVVALAAAGTAYATQIRTDDAETTKHAPAATAEVTQETLADTQSWSGTLGHGAPFSVDAAGSGKITWLPRLGSKVRRGSPLYRVDQVPVIALIGRIPMYRDLQTGASGTDVRQLEKNLAALGYAGFTVDDDYTSNTAQAVRDWQDDLDIAVTGTVSESSLVFLPRGGRVDTVHVAVGDEAAPGVALLDLTGTDQVVSIDVAVGDRDQVTVGTAVRVRTPGDDEATGRVTSAKVVEDTSEGAAEGDTVTAVEVALDKLVDTTFLGGPAEVTVEIAEHPNVLVVPVSALLALNEGGFGLEVISEDGTTSIVAVETGLFADGKVEVSGDGITEGTTVGVAGR